MKNYDVFSFGVISTSIQYLLQEGYPHPGDYAEITGKFKNVGGEAANTSIVLSRLGLKVKLDGNWINPDEDVDFLLQVFQKNQVDVSRLSLRKCSGPKEMLVVDSKTRTIFGSYAQMLHEKSWNQAHISDIQNAKIVCLDPFFGSASLQVAQQAKQLQKLVVTIDCSFEDPILSIADVFIISEEFINHTYPDSNPASLAQAFQEHTNGILIFTFGSKEIIYTSSDGDFRSVTPFKVDTVDTTGAGDSFRAGIIFGIHKGWPTAKSVKFASALAAMVCQSFPGVLNSPSYDQVISFMKDHPPMYP